jgi:hypothetical protein
MNLLIAIAILFVLWQGIRFFARAKPQTVVRVVKMMGGLCVFAVAGLLFLRGHVEMALALGGVGLWLIGWGAPPIGFRNAGSAPQSSRVRSAMIEMEMDLSSGAMEGRVLAGVFEGRRLSELARPQCDALYADCLRDDPDGARLLEAYLDRRFPGWGETVQRDADAGSSHIGARRSGAMTEDEAYEVLGLQKGAARDEIARAHRALMKKLHPDHGGTTSLAARVNEAKDVLMRRHQ